MPRYAAPPPPEPTLARALREPLLYVAGTEPERFGTLFVRGEACAEGFWAEALGADVLAALAGADLLERGDGTLRSRLQIVPFRDMLVASDPPRAGQDPDYVMGIGPATRSLAELTPRGPRGRTLDLGTGCGAHALLAAAHSEHVIGTDLAPRALALARFNAALNAADTVEFREGSWLEPVADLRFDLVVCNPPYVLSPERELVYRDGGLADGGDADGVCAHLARAIPDVLSENGACHMLANWPCYAGEQWHERLAGWFADRGCDAWVLHSESDDVAAYARAFLATTSGGPVDPERLRRWLDWFEQRGVDRVAAGVFCFRRRSGASNWLRAEDMPRVFPGAGDALAQGFALRDFLDACPDDDALADQRLVLSPDARLDQTARPGRSGWEVEQTSLRLVRGLGWEGPADPVVAGLLAACDGGRELGQVIAEVGASLAAPSREVRASSLRAVRALVERGFLLPAGFRSLDRVREAVL